MLTGTRTLVVERRVERWSREESGTENKSTKPQENRAGRENKSRARAQTGRENRAGQEHRQGERWPKESVESRCGYQPTHRSANEVRHGFDASRPVANASALAGTHALAERASCLPVALADSATDTLA